MIVLVAVLAFLVGAAAGAFVVFRTTPRLVARLPKAEQIAFAKKVSASRR